MDDLSMLLISFFTWVTLYFSLCIINPKRSYEWHIRSVTTIHALVVTVLGVYSIFVAGPWPLTKMGGPTSAFQQFVVAVSLGYFVLDLSWCLYFKTEGLVMLFHHTLSIAGLGVTYILRTYGIEIVTTIFGAEITNPLLQLRWFLKETNNYDTKLGDVVDVAFMVSFGVFRIFLGSILLYYHVTMATTDWLASFGGLCIYSVGWVFWISIVQYGIKKYKRKYGRSASTSVTNGVVTANRTNNASTLTRNGSTSNMSATETGDADSDNHTHAAGENLAGQSNGVARMNGEINGNVHKRHVQTNGVQKPIETAL